MWKRNISLALLTAAGLVTIGILIYQIPYVNQRLSWRLDFAFTYLRSVVNPAGEVPTALPPPAVAITSHPQPTVAETGVKMVAAIPTPSPTLTPTPLPESVTLTAPKWELQDINNCGPAALTMYLRYFGWGGDQLDIANILKPQRHDRNVNVDELVYYVRNYAGWLNAEFRVAGDIKLLKTLLAAGLPVIVEETFYFESAYWPNDDLWAAHYNLLTGYDDAEQVFITQDSYHGANLQVSYEMLDEYWQTFNRIYLVVYPVEQEELVKSILGEDWDVDANRQRALEISQGETKTDPDNPYAWFNLGSSLVWFERYAEAAQAYDKARQIGIPQRMLRYQFGPFFAYFHANRNDDLLALTEYALKRTPTSEEALLWHGWALYRQGEIAEAVAEFQRALVENPNYLDAQNALRFVGY
ncbi:MAG: tetratricopeptide repeat protein [Anaerolineales bacterium]|nr:tetratricopeptide repeat protein [Anaerolineales bacterium]